jgi:hypothetical protein
LPPEARVIAGCGEEISSEADNHRIAETGESRKKKDLSCQKAQTVIALKKRRWHKNGEQKHHHR